MYIWESFPNPSPILYTDLTGRERMSRSFEIGANPAKTKKLHCDMFLLPASQVVTSPSSSNLIPITSSP